MIFFLQASEVELSTNDLSPISLAKTQKTRFLIIPAEANQRRSLAGIQENKYFWPPAFAGVTVLMAFYE